MIFRHWWNRFKQPLAYAMYMEGYEFAAGMLVSGRASTDIMRKATCKNPLANKKVKPFDDGVMRACRDFEALLKERNLGITVE